MPRRTDELLATAPRHVATTRIVRLPAHRAIPAATPPVLPRVFDLSLVAVGTLGVLSILWWLVSSTFGLGLVTFATGSMTPEYPVGSLALTERIALQDVRIGDVVTVDRGPDAAPITHRVIGIRVAADGDSAVVRLKGDANVDPDPAPYRVTELHRILLPLPAFADVLRYLGTPWSAGVIAMLIAGALCWAFWPSADLRAGRGDPASADPVAVA